MANYHSEKILCPLISSEIEPIECVVNCDCVSGMIKIDNMPDVFKKSPDYAEICKNCKYHNQ